MLNLSRLNSPFLTSKEFYKTLQSSVSWLPPHRLVTEVAKVFPDAIFYKPTTEKVIALTIDDLPTPQERDDYSSHLILNAIADHNQQIDSVQNPVQATFFIISSHLNHHSTLLHRIIAHGHEIGNHGVKDEMSAWLPPSEFEKQFKICHSGLFPYCQQGIRWYRPGRALYNPQMLETLRRMSGYEPRFALASMMPLDTLELTNDPRFTAWYASQFIFPGAILVLHGGSISRAKNTAIALKQILAQAQDQGFRIVTLSQLWNS